MKSVNGVTLSTLNRTVMGALAVAILTAVVSSSALAGVYGKISGTIRNHSTGDPLVGATVKVQGTNLATETDADGEYFIINVPVGKYDLVVSHVGFDGVVKKGVRILVDLTTPVDFDMASAPVELNRQSIVNADAPVIQRDQTASKVIFTADRLRNLPNINSVQSVLTNYPGVVIDKAEGLHVRGGRSGQVAYYVDGFSVQDPFVAQAGMRIMPASLEELSLTSGGFAPEYGEALSGIVNAVTREGGAAYKGGVRTYQGATHVYDVTVGRWESLNLNQNRSLSFNLSGPIPGLPGERYSFFTSGEYYRDYGYLPHDWKTSYTATTKFSMQPIAKMRIRAVGSYSKVDGAVYTHRDVNGASFDFALDGLPMMKSESYLAGLSANYVPAERTMWSISISRFSTWTLTSPKHLFGTHWELWPGYSVDSNGVYNGTIQDNNYVNDRNYADPYELTGFMTGNRFDPTYSYRKSVDNSVTATWIQQMSKTNQIKSGVSLDLFHVNRDSKKFYNSKPYSEFYDSEPVYFSWYAQDKLEYQRFVINAGLRYDYRDPDMAYRHYHMDNGTLASVWEEATAKKTLSPRFGVSFPVSDKTVMHANYGVYYQTPTYRYLYMNVAGDLTSGLPLLGNPDLKPEKTVSYELGVDHLVGDYLRLDVTAYYKDFSDLVTTRKAFVHGSYPVTHFTNQDYGTATGFDIEIERLKVNGYVSGSISYGYMVARGIGSNAMEPYYTYITNNSDTLAPVNEYPLDFDQRHTLTTVVEVRFPQNWRGRFFGIPVPGGWGLTTVGYLGSGLPYTKSDDKGTRLGSRNEGRLPASSSVDMRFNKDVILGRSHNMLTFFVEVENLFNRHNVLAVYPSTGLPDDDGFRNTTGLALDQKQLDDLNRLYDRDPQNFSSPRTVRLGLEYSF
ncbi:MAG: TonB-dependent receptor [candidate division Zixibacteria bacterium]|nr:TonB-dependent receptor [candidate division Zixibacteria bacterium]